MDKKHREFFEKHINAAGKKIEEMALPALTFHHTDLHQRIDVIELSLLEMHTKLDALLAYHKAKFKEDN